jgi:hypothetical protein
MRGEWEKCAMARPVGSAALQEGLCAYAVGHIRREERMCERLSRQWAGLQAKVAAYLAGLEVAGPEVVVDMGEDVDEEDEEGDVEGVDLPRSEDEDEEGDDP